VDELSHLAPRAASELATQRAHDQLGVLGAEPSAFDLRAEHGFLPHMPRLLELPDRPYP
jgi:hypothetical protein